VDNSELFADSLAPQEPDLEDRHLFMWAIALRGIYESSLAPDVSRRVSSPPSIIPPLCPCRSLRLPCPSPSLPVPTGASVVDGLELPSAFRLPWLSWLCAKMVVVVYGPDDGLGLETQGTTVVVMMVVRGFQEVGAFGRVKVGSRDGGGSRLVVNKC